MTGEFEFFSAHDLFRSSYEFDIRNCGLESLLAQSTYSPSSVSIRKFIDELPQPGLDSPEKKFFYGLRQSGHQSLLGFALLRLNDELADLDFIIMSESFRGLGFAKALLEKSLNEVQLVGATRVMLEVGESNLAAQALYCQFGFKVISIRKKYYKNGENALIMELIF